MCASRIHIVDSIFNQPVINHGNFRVHGYKEEGTTTTPFDLTAPMEIPGGLQSPVGALATQLRNTYPSASRVRSTQP